MDQLKILYSCLEAFNIKLAAPKLYLYSAVPKNSEESLRKYGLMSGKKLLSNKNALKAIFPDGKERAKWEKKVSKLLESPEDKYVYFGPNCFFSEPDMSKVKKNKKHPIIVDELQIIKINVTKLLKPHPETEFYGIEMWPVLPKEDEEDFVDKDKRIGLRERFLSLEEVKEFAAKSPKELWKHYSPLAGFYAANVPHVAVITKSGTIPFEFLEF